MVGRRNIRRYNYIIAASNDSRKWSEDHPFSCVLFKTEQTYRHVHEDHLDSALMIVYFALTASLGADHLHHDQHGSALFFLVKTIMLV